MFLDETPRTHTVVDSAQGSNRVFKRLKKVGSRGNEAEGQPGEWRSAEEQLMLELFGDCAG